MRVIEFERWLPVVGNPLYEVSSLGKVRNTHTRHVLKPAPNSQGYLCVLLYKGSKASRRSFLVHRLVAEAFLANPSTLPQVNHRNGQKQDNRAFNLEWCTPAHNMRHAVEIGLTHQILSDDDVRTIRREYRAQSGQWSNTRELAERYGVAVNTIKGIVKRADRARVAA